MLEKYIFGNLSRFYSRRRWIDALRQPTVLSCVRRSQNRPTSHSLCVESRRPRSRWTNGVLLQVRSILLGAGLSSCANLSATSQVGACHTCATCGIVCLCQSHTGWTVNRIRLPYYLEAITIVGQLKTSRADDVEEAQAPNAFLTHVGRASVATWIAAEALLKCRSREIQVLLESLLLTVPKIRGRASRFDGVTGCSSMSAPAREHVLFVFGGSTTCAKEVVRRRSWPTRAQVILHARCTTLITRADPEK